MKRHKLPPRIQKIVNELARRIRLLLALPAGGYELIKAFFGLVASGLESVIKGKDCPALSLNFKTEALGNEDIKKIKKIFAPSIRLGVKLGEALAGSRTPTIYIVEIFAAMAQAGGGDGEEIVRKSWVDPNFGPDLAREEAELLKLN